MEQIVQFGRVIRGWLGVNLRPQPMPGGPAGLLVIAVNPGGPAFLAGLRPGDFVLSINQVQATDLYTVTDVIANAEPGSELHIEVLRDQRRFRATAIAGELPEPV